MIRGMGHLLYEERLAEIALFKSGKKKASGWLSST